MKMTFKKRAVSLALALLMAVMSVPLGALELFASTVENEVTVKTYDQLKSTLESAKVGLTVIITADITIPSGKTISVPKGVKLALAHSSSGAYGANRAEDYVVKKTDTRFSDNFLFDDPVYTLTVEKGASLNIYGSLNIGGVLCAAANSAVQGQTGAVYSLLKLDGTLNLVGGELRNYGYIVGDGVINGGASSDIYAPFVISGFGGGGLVYGLGMVQVDSPVTQYNIPAIQTKMVLAYSAEFYAMGALSCMNEANAFESKLVGITDALITLDSADAYIETEYVNSEGSLIGKTDVTIYGDAHAEALTLEIFYKKVSTADAIFPLPYGFDLTFKNGTFTVMNRYSILPGAKVTVDKSAELVVKNGGGLYISSGAVDYDMHLFSKTKYRHYPLADVLRGSGYEERGVLDVHGSVVVEKGGIFAGIVDNSKYGAKIRIDDGAVTSGSFNLGIAASYNINFTDYAYYNKTTYNLKAQALGTDGKLFDLKVGKTYFTADPDASLHMTEFSYIYHGNSAGEEKQNLVGTISTYIKGSLAEKGVVYNYPDGTVEKSSDTVNLKANTAGYYWYDAYTGLLVQSFKNSEAFYMLNSANSAIKVNTGDETVYLAAVGGVIPQYNHEKEHYIFKGYSAKDDGTAEYQAGDKVPVGMTELYAVWEAREYTVRYVLDKENYNIYGSSYLYVDGELYVIFEKTYKYLDDLDLSFGVSQMAVKEKYFEWNSEGEKKATDNADLYGVYFEYGVRNLRTGVIHTSLAVAIQYAENGDTLRLQSDTCESVTIPAGKEITIDLGTSKLYYEGESTIVNSGKLTITAMAGGEISQTGNGASSADVFYAVENLEGGEFILESGKISTASASQYTRSVNNKGTFILNGGSISSKTGYAIYNYGATAKFVQNGGEVTFSGTSASNYGVYNYNKSEYTINGGSIVATGGGRAFYNYLKSAFNVNGGTVQSSGGTVFNNGSEMNVRGGTIMTTSTSSSIYVIQNTKQSSNLGTLNVYGGSIVATAGARGIYNYNSVLNVYGGYIATEGNSTAAWGVYNYYLSTMNVYGGKIYSKKSHGVYNYSASKTNIPTANFYGGEVITDSTTSYYPVINAASNKYGNLNIEGGSFISASAYAVYSGSTSYKVNVKADALGGIYGYETAAFYNFTNNTGKTLKYTALNSGAYCLADASAVKNITCDGTAYAYIAEALAAAKSGSVIRLGADTVVNHPEIIGNGIAIDLNGNTLSIGSNTMTVTGEAYLTDGAGGGGISLREGVKIYEGVLEFASSVNGKKVVGYSCDGGTEFYTSVPNDADFVIYPAYEDSVRFTVVFKDLDGSIIAKYELSYNEVIPLPGDPSIESDGRYKYTFTGWSPKVEDLCTANREYVAQYDIEEIKYSVIFRDADGVVISASAYVWEQAVVAPEAPYLPSDCGNYYTFLGWYDSNGVKFDWEKVYSSGDFTAKYESHALTTESITTTVGFNSATVVMESSMVINFRVLASDFEGYDKLYAEFVREYADDRQDKSVIVEDYTVNGDYLVFPLKGIAAKEMNDNVNATLYAVKGETKYVYKSIDYSVVKYAMNNLGKSSTSAAYKTLLVDMLNYGAMAQIHLGYNTDNLANGKLTDAQKAYGSYSGGDIDLNSVRNYERPESEKVAFRSASVVFADNVLIKYQLNFANYSGNKEDVSVLVKYTDVNGTEHNKLIGFEEMEQNGNYYTFEFTEVAVKDMGMPVVAVIYENYESPDRVQLSGVLTYSVESYAASKYSVNGGTLSDLVSYMIAYSRSADKYFSK
ncbi:MAG: hypothetical protein E7675_02315 [Ruminococcaceae bacterium]|nr:hypothetical protein [Oscillospiraceae bacterium]